jgi:hypothetical protein
LSTGDSIALKSHKDDIGNLLPRNREISTLGGMGASDPSKTPRASLFKNIIILQMLDRNALADVRAG